MQGWKKLQKNLNVPLTHLKILFLLVYIRLFGIFNYLL